MDLESKIPMLRIGPTSKCNKTCIYCRPGGEIFPVGYEMSSSDILYLVNLIVDQGVTELKLTGGEPLLRSDILQIVQQLKQVRNVRSLHLVTRHPKAGDYAEAFKRKGLDCLNFSLDSLDPHTWSWIVYHDTIKGFSEHQELVEAIKMAALSGIHIKINTVVMRGINDHEITALIDFAGQINCELKFLELIREVPYIDPLFGPKYYYELDGLTQKLARDARKIEVVTQPGGLGHPMTKLELKNGATIIVMTQKTGAWYGMMCNSCSFFPCDDALMALRLTPDGKLQFCLLRRDNMIDLHGLMRSVGKTEDIKDVIRNVINVYRESKFYGYLDIEKIRSIQKKVISNDHLIS